MLFDDLQRYIDSKIGADTSISTEIPVKEQYSYGEKANPPEILIELVDDTEYSRATTFGGERASTVLLQIIVMTNQMTISKVRMSPQKACRILSKKVDDMFDKVTVKESIPQILTLRRVQLTNPMPYEHGTTAYYSILRLELVVQK